MNLWEKIAQTVPGKHARALGDIRYCSGHKLEKDDHDRLSAAEAYLERLALAELRCELKEREPWAEDLLKKVGELK